ncbi:hypothetical protein GCM10029992_63140 [Glycomyces albus]
MDDAAVGQDHGAVEAVGERPDLVRDQQDGASGVEAGGDDLGERGLGLGVDADGRLVHDQHVGVGGEGAGDEDALLLAAREGVDRAAGVLGQADLFEAAPDRLAVAAAGGHAEEAVRQAALADDLGGGGRNAGGRTGALGDVADALPVAEAALGGAEQLDLASCRRDQSDDRLDQCGFTGAVGAHDGDGLSSFDGEVDAAYDGATAVGDGRAAGCYDGHGLIVPMPPRGHPATRRGCRA